MTTLTIKHLLGRGKDQGRLYHAVRPHGYSLCGLKPARGSRGWSSELGRMMTCDSCKRALLRTTEEFCYAFAPAS